MKRPKTTVCKKPTQISDDPQGPQFDAGFLPEINAGWRTFRPVVNHEECNFCLRCYLVCPDGTIFKNEKKIHIDMDYCKGCGVCAYECKVDAIDMVKEEI